MTAAPSPAPPEEPGPPAVEVLARLLADREGGDLGPLASYLELFPGREQQVTREYQRVTSGPGLPESDPDAPSSNPEFVGPYRLLRLLGRGGQGSVWLARDPRLDREIALKIVPVSPLIGNVSRRFQREARTASQLDHPGLCPVYDVGSEGSVAWIAMRYVPGQTLAQRVRDSAEAERDPAPIVALIEQLAHSLHAAHEAGVVHRDVKPANVIVTPEGDPVLLDFGIARDDQEGGAPLTLTGDTLGTPAYMSPEQLSGLRVERRTDVWSLGVTAYELLGGERPFDAPTREGVVRAVLERDPGPVSRLNPAVSRDLDVVIATALAKPTDRRYATAAHLAEDLARVRAGRPILARPVGPLERIWLRARRHPGVAVSLTALFVVLTAALTVTTRALSRTRAALLENATLLEEITQLADAKVAGDLLEQEPLLWPATPDRAPEMARWLARAHNLERGIDAHRQALAALDEHDGVATPIPAETQAWMRDELTQIIASVEQLLERIPELEARHALARDLYAVTIADRSQDWSAAAARVRSDPRFDGLQLVPQLGLLPLGPDLESGLEEFAHIASGEPAVRESGTGRIVMTESSSIVLILVPGGETTVGCNPPSSASEPGQPLEDPLARPEDGPVIPLHLDPFLISKFEMTSGQWLAQTRELAALYARPGNGRSEVPLLQPVEQVSSVRATAVLAQLELELPTEAQWEHAARAGTTTVWYTGNDPRSLIGHANLSDEGCRDAGGAPAWEYVAWLDDGHTVTAPVGSFLPNPFGLHDVAGNVFEWTRTPYSSLPQAPPIDGDGASEWPTSARVVRGGSFAKPEFYARSGHRDGLPGHLLPPDIGLRPARRLAIADPGPQAATKSASRPR